MSETSNNIYEYSNNNIKYIVELSYNEKDVIFKVKEENSLNKIFEESFSLSILIEKNNIFKVCNTIKDCYNLFLKFLNNNKYIITNDANKIIITFFIKDIITENEEELKLTLNSKQIDINSIIENCNNIIQDLKKENNILKSEITLLKEEISKLKYISNEYKSFKENINSIIDERIKYILNQQKEIKIFHDLNYSSILGNLDEKIYFQKLVKCQNLKLLYRLSRDGSSPNDFHKLCDNQGATITIFKSNNNRKFGGYLSKNWESEGKWKKDNNVFLFSIDLKKIYKIKNIKNSYYCYKDIGPSFQNFGFENYGNLLEERKCSEHDLRTNYEVNQEYQKYEISGEENILCKDIEVYKVEF